MHRWLATLAALVAVGVFGFWLTAGAHRGWTRTSVLIESVEPVTGLTERRYENRFVPGIDFLGAGLGLASLLAAAAWFARRRA